MFHLIKVRAQSGKALFDNVFQTFERAPRFFR